MDIPAFEKPLRSLYNSLGLPRNTPRRRICGEQVTFCVFFISDFEPKKTKT